MAQQAGHFVSVGRQGRLERLAELAVDFGANVQPGQILAVNAEPGQEPLVRAIAEVAYERGAQFVDVFTFDQHVKRARLRHADRDLLTFVPDWYRQRERQLGEERGALIALRSRGNPRLMEDVEPGRLGLDLLPRMRERSEAIRRRLVNWTIVPFPTADWALAVHPDLDPAAALTRLWDQIADVCRLDETDPAGAWETRMEQLGAMARRLNALSLDALHYEGPGTDLRVGLLPGSRWVSAPGTTADGIVHRPNLPTEEVYTAPDPERVDGIVAATRPLFVSGGLVTGLRVEFRGGRAVSIDAGSGAEILRTMTGRDAGAARLGEVALVDRESRVGQQNTVFFETLLDENSVSHIALGSAYEKTVDESDVERINRSEIHVDFMIGSAQVSVTGARRDGSEVPLLVGGEWQI